jgi:cysteine desulfurase/selenocysteine lyase
MEAGGGIVIYLDHAATAGQRPPEVAAAVHNALTRVAANPGRSGHHLALAAARIVEEARYELAGLLGAPDPAHVILTSGGTEAINLVLRGFLGTGDRVLASCWEHNAVMRPLRWLEEAREIRLDLIPPGADCPLDLTWLEREVSRGDCRLVTCMLASNVTGEPMPWARVGALCRNHGVFFLVDGAQGCGVLDLQVERDHVDALALTGHKSLYGPPGTGALYLRTPELVEPLVRGGTGSRSEEEVQPTFLPDRYEAGTRNTPGLAGLAAGVRHVRQRTPAALCAHLDSLRGLLAQHLDGLPGVTLHGPDATGSQVARRLEQRGVLCRPGLHCAPRAHRTLGTHPGGTVRFSLSSFTTAQEVEQAAAHLREILAAGRTGT